MIFNSLKKIKVGYFHKYSTVLPRFLFQDISAVVGCPSAASLKNRIYGVKPLISMEVKFGIDDNGEPYYTYIFDSKNFHKVENIHNAIDEILTVQKVKNKCVLQVLQFVHLVTDDKNLEVVLVEPVNKNYKNCEFVTAAFLPYGWIRSINASYIQSSNKEGSVSINVNKNIYRLIFNRPVVLENIEPNEKIIRYESTVFNVAGFLKNLNNIYPRILKTRPKKFLK